MLSESGSGLSKDRTVHYVAGTGDDIKLQPDFIVAKNENNSRSATDAASAVDLQFSHALTAITFAVGKNMVPGKISKITVRGVKGEGDYNIATNTWNTDGIDANAEYTIDNLGPNNDGTITGEKDVALTNNDQTLLMIPQSLGSNAEVEIVFDNDNGAKTLTASLNSTSWTAGHSIIYKLSASEVTTLSLGNIEFPTNWSSQYTTTANKLKSAYDGTEKVGLFVVDDQGYIRNANVQLTYNSSTKSWNLPKGTNVLFSPRFKYFAYCNPTSTDLSNALPQVGTTVTNTTDAASFFSDIINAWSPSSDQSSLSKLNACDLQIGMANISNTASSIDFNMTHAMGLAEVTLTTKQDCNCELYNDANYTWVGPVPASENFGTNKMFKMTDYEYTNNKFVAIVKPNIEADFCGGEKEYGVWSTTIPAIEANAIGYGSSILNLKQKFTLEFGDMYYSDGAMTHQSEALASGKTPIGIVGYIGNNYWTEKGTVIGDKTVGGHALVMGLKTIGSTASNSGGSGFAWSSNNDNSRPKVNTASLIIGSSNATYGSGYIETNALLTRSAAAKAAKEYTTLPAKSDKCTGWFLPTAGQYYAIMTGLGTGLSPSNWSIDNFFSSSCMDTVSDKINNALKKAGTNNYTEFSLGGSNISEWTSTNYDSSNAIDIDPGYNNKNTYKSFRFQAYGKTSELRVRPFLAF